MEKLQEVSENDLSNEAYFALWYSLAVIYGGQSAKLFKDAEANLKMSASAKTNALQKGLNELAEKGLISLARNGLGEYEPAQVHLKLMPSSGLITRDNT
jgi:hypothetical protein